MWLDLLCTASLHSWETCGWIYCTQCHFTVGLDQNIHSWTDLCGGASVTSQLGLTKPFTAGLVWRRNNFGKHVAGFIVHSVTSQLGLTKAFTAGRTCLAAQQTCGWIYRTQCHFTVRLDQTIHSWTFLAAQQAGFIVHSVTLLYTVSLHSWA